MGLNFSFLFIQGFSSSECTSFEVFCPSGECVGADRICDGIRDCLDASDELKCSEQCNFDQHECDYGHCIEKKLICDGKVDCPSDNSDERNCPSKDTYMTHYQTCIMISP